MGNARFHSRIKSIIWLSRDPIEEMGGKNLYGFVGNDGINEFDLFGLTWFIIRNGGSRASAYPEKGDTVAGLASQISLDDTDYQKWLKPKVGSLPSSVTQPLIGCEVFTIPNTVYIDFGKYGFLDNYFGAIGKWRDSLNAFAQNEQSQGYNVIICDPSTSGTAANHLATDNIYGFAYAGHGAGAGQLVFDPSNKTNNDTLQPVRRTLYGIAFLYAYGCATATQQSLDSSHPGLGARMGYEYSVWEKNVAKRGKFTGVYGAVNGNEAWSHIVSTPGTNTK